MYSHGPAHGVRAAVIGFNPLRIVRIVPRPPILKESGVMRRIFVDIIKIGTGGFWQFAQRDKGARFPIRDYLHVKPPDRTKQQDTRQRSALTPQRATGP